MTEDREWLVRRVSECRVKARTASEALDVSDDDGAIAETVEVLVTRIDSIREVVIQDNMAMEESVSVGHPT